jgi:signal peptidase II
VEEYSIMTFRQKYTALLVIAALVTGLDQASKYLILEHVRLHESFSLIPGFLDIAHVKNPGVAFGLFSQNKSNIQQLVLMSASFVAVCVVFYFYNQTSSRHRFMLAGFALILGGAIGNFIDRIRLGEVVDFIDIYIGDLHWPTFNIADSAVSIGIVIFIYHLIFKKPDIFYRLSEPSEKRKKS